MSDWPWSAVSCALVLSSCGGQAASEGAGDDVPDGGPPGSAGAAGGGSAGGGTGGSGGAEREDSGHVTKPGCTGFDDAPSADVTVVFENVRSTPIFVTPPRPSGPATRFRIVDPDGQSARALPGALWFRILRDTGTERAPV